MNLPLSCGAQDMLEAAIVQRRRLDLKCIGTETETISYKRVLAIDIGTIKGIEYLTLLTTDNHGGIIKLPIPTSEIISFNANDYLDPRIEYQRKNDPNCSIEN